jgi:hypothetical protein
MPLFRRKVCETVAGTRGEPTDSPFHGAIVDPGTLKDISDTGIIDWIRKSPGVGDLEPTQENYPAAWQAGRELARARYAERLKAFDPIPRDDREAAHVALKERSLYKAT